MFLNAIKLFFIKKSLNKSLFNEAQSGFVSEFKTVALLIEEAHLPKKTVIEDVLIANGITKNNLSVLVFKQEVKKEEKSEFPFFGMIDLKLNGGFKEGSVTEFINTKYDLLISYYDSENPVLLSVTKKSKAKFKVGFALENYFMNDLSVQTTLSDATSFSNELIKYLKILYKID